jgi:hypothetical protein
MKQILSILFLAIPVLAQANPIRAVISPRVIAVAVNGQDGRGNQFRASLIRRGGESTSNLSIVLEQINYASGDAGTVISQLVVSPGQLKYGADTVVADLRLNSDGDGFSFTEAPMSTIGHVYSCIFRLPEEPVYGAQALKLTDLSCK